MKIFKGYVRDWNLSDWEAKEVHLRFAKQIPDLGYRLTVQHPFPRPELLSRQKIGRKVQYSWNVNRPQREELFLGPKEKMARKPVQGAWPRTSLTVYVGHNRHIVHPDYDMIPPENGEKLLQSQEDSPEFQAVYMPREELFLPLPARRSAFEDRIPACHWCFRRDHMATVDRTHSHPAVWCNLSSFIHQRNGLMWSNPRGNTGEAAAMRPNSLRQVPTETWWPSLKRARHAVRSGIRAGAKRACIWTESKRTPRNTVRWDGSSTLFLAFILRPREWMWPRTISLWRLTSSLEWARMSQSSR